MSLVGSTKVEIVVFFCSRWFFSVGVTVESSFFVSSQCLHLFSVMLH